MTNPLEGREARIIYRCGWCGQPVKNDGSLLALSDRDIQLELLEATGKDIKEESVHGYCCPNGEDSNSNYPQRVTRDMAMDAQDLDLEGQEY